MSRLLNSGKEFRDNLLNKNIYNDKEAYDISHKNALSDGDEYGKGELNGSIGSLSDIKMRSDLSNKNIYSFNREYGESDTV